MSLLNLYIIYTKYLYLPITNVPEYLTFQYQFNYISVYTLVTFIYCIPPIFMLYKMLRFYTKNKSRIIRNGILPDLYKSFLIMQCSCVWYTVADFLMVRIPTTTIITPICAKSDASMVCNSIVAFFYFSYLSAQLYTLQFNLLRVIVVFSWQSERICSIISSYSTPLIVAASFISNIPMFFGRGLCIQMGGPYQFGSVMIVNTIIYGKLTASYCYLVFSSIITISIIALNFCILAKSKKHTIRTSQLSSQRRRKSERILTITMILTLIPVFCSFSISALNIFKSPLFPYFVLLRAVLIDIRLITVTVYFYLRHPIFKKETKTTSVINTI